MSLDIRIGQFTDLKFHKLMDHADGSIAVIATVSTKESGLAATESEIIFTTTGADVSARLERAIAAFNAAMEPMPTVTFTDVIGVTSYNLYDDDSLPTDGTRDGV